MPASDDDLDLDIVLAENDRDDLALVLGQRYVGSDDGGIQLF